MGYLSKLWAVVLFAVAFVLTNSAHVLAASTELYIDAASAEVSIGQSLTVTIKVNSGSEQINAVQAYLSYPAEIIEVTSIRSSSIFNSEAENEAADGALKLAVGSYKSISGVNDVATVTFRAISNGKADVAFESGSAVAKFGDGSNVLAASRPGVYLVKPGVAAPQPATAPTSGPASPSLQTIAEDKNARENASAIPYEKPASGIALTNQSGSIVAMLVAGGVLILIGALIVIVKIVRSRLQRNAASSLNYTDTSNNQVVVGNAGTHERRNDDSNSILSLLSKITGPTAIVLGVAFLGTFTLQQSAANAPTTFYVNPATGSADGDGSMERPWKTLEEVIVGKKIETFSKAGEVKNAGAPVNGGDTIILFDGYHGSVALKDAHNKELITIKAAPSTLPQLGTIDLIGAERWRFEGLSISPSHNNGSSLRSMNVVSISGNGFFGRSGNNEIVNNDIFSIPDISAWKAEDWIAKAATGVREGGESNSIINNRIRNVWYGISSSGDKLVAQSNSINNFGGDGIRGLGSYSTYEYNVIKDLYAVNDEHHDGFQSWSRSETGGAGSGTVYGVTLRGNTFINWTNPSRPYVSSMQGIGCFDGMFSGWTVENNLVIVDHWHGITFMGMLDSKVVNNTVMDINPGVRPGPTWIRIVAHKNTTPSKNVLIRNNLAASTITGTNTANGIVSDHNVTVKDYAAYFMDAAKNDFSLRSGSPAIDAGSNKDVPTNDMAGSPRVDVIAIINKGSDNAFYDLGALEYQLADDDNPVVIPEDVTNDQKIDIQDFSMLLFNWQKRIANTKKMRPDIDKNGIVNDADLRLFIAKFRTR